MNIRFEKLIIAGVALLFTIVFFVSLRGLNTLHGQPLEVSPIRATLPPVEVKIPKYDYVGSLEDFMYSMAYHESGNRSHIVNRYGYMGKYQFGRSTLDQLGFRVSRKEFLHNAELQDSAFVRYLRYNKEVLQPVIEQYDGKMYKGFLVTESGLLAGAHLVGPNGVRAFFDPNFRVKMGEGLYVRPRLSDANGVRVTTYMKRFSQYDVSDLGD